MKLKNKIILLVLTIACLASLSSCGGSMTDETARAELERLLPVAYELNEILWGEGLPIEETDSADRYLAVAKDCGYSTTDDILNKAAEVFSTEYLEGIKDAIFVGDKDGYPAIYPRYIDVNGVLKADVQNTGYDVKSNIIISSATIEKQNRGAMTLFADCEDGYKMKITLVLEDGKWLLDSATY